MIPRDCQRCHGQMYLFALVVMGLTAWLEFWGSYRTASTALFSDAWHVVFDGFGYLVGAVYAPFALYHIVAMERLKHLRRWCELAIAVFLVVTAFVIFGKALHQMWFGYLPHIERSGLLFTVASVGLGANFLLLVLFQAFGLNHDHGEGKDHSHQYGRIGANRILQGNIWHTLSDTISSLLVIVNAVIFSLSDNPTWRYLDPSVSVIIALALFWQGVTIFSEEE